MAKKASYTIADVFERHGIRPVLKGMIAEVEECEKEETDPINSRHLKRLRLDLENALFNWEGRKSHEEVVQKAVDRVEKQFGLHSPRDPLHD